MKNLWEQNGFKSSGTWSEIFGKSAFADEAFMAWNYAKFINTVAANGKSEYNLPMFVNALDSTAARQTTGRLPIRRSASPCS